MYTSILLAFWAAIAFVIFRAVRFIINERHHRARARELGCDEPPAVADQGSLGIKLIRKTMNADKENRLPEHFNSLFGSISASADRRLSTMKFNQLGADAIFTADPRNIQAILATQFKDYGLGDTRNGNFAPLLGHGIFSSDGKDWERARSLLRPQFVREQVSDLDLEERHVQDLMRVLPVNADGWTELTNIQPLFFRLTIDSATEFLFGESVDSQLADLPGHKSRNTAPELDEKMFTYNFDNSQAGISWGGRFGDMYWIAHTAAFKKLCKKCHVFIDHYVDKALNKDPEAKLSSTGKARYVFLDALAESTQNPTELREHLISILLAGRDTTASLLSFVFAFLIQYPDVFKTLRATILDDFGTYSNPKEITFARLKSCSYLQWVLNETLRLYPIVPLDSRRALVDSTIPTGGGPDGTKPIYVRKGQEVTYSTYVMQRRTDLWGPDATEFKPERWRTRRPGWEYLPFNGGPRICIGQQFALTEAGYVIVRLLQRFDGLMGEGNGWESVEKGGFGRLRTKITLTLSPADGVKIRFKAAKE